MNQIVYSFYLPKIQELGIFIIPTNGLLQHQGNEEFFQNQEVVIKGQKSDSHHIPLGKQDTLDVKGEVNPTPIPEPEVYFSGETHVNIDKEMSAMAQNQIRFRFASLHTNSFFAGLSSSITGTISR